MAKLSIKRFLFEYKSSVIITASLPAGIVLRSVLVNTLCDEADNTLLQQRQRHYVTQAHKVTGNKKDVIPTFANTIGSKALNVFSLPYTIVSTVRQSALKLIDAAFSIGGPAIQSSRPTPWYGVALKAVIAVPLAPVEGICYSVAKMTDKIFGFFSGKNTASQISPTKLSVTITKYSNTDTTTSVKNALSNSASNSSNHSASSSPVSTPKSTAVNPFAEKLSPRDKKVRIHVKTGIFSTALTERLTAQKGTDLAYKAPTI